MPVTPHPGARPGGHADWLRPGWSAAGIGALMTTRAGGASVAPFDSLNLRFGLGDDPLAVASTRARLHAAIGAVPVYLDQVHGAAVRRLTPADAVRARDRGEPLPVADASVTSVPGIACTVQVADCLPVLFAAPDAGAVGAAHAGWRGLALGVLEATVAGVCEAAGYQPAELQAWLGACIGPGAFEVGADVLDAFGASPGAPTARFQPLRPGKWLADLPGLARDRLGAAGVHRVFSADACTVGDPSRFFSFRRDRVTGRMVAAIWIEGGSGR
jgi:YfiH family protein